MSLRNLTELFDKCYEIEIDVLRQWSGLISIEWNSEKMDSFTKYGIVMHLYKEEDPLLLGVIDLDYDYQQLYTLICREIDKRNNETLNMFPRNSMSSAIIKTTHPSEGENLVNWYRKYNFEKYKLIADETEKRALSLIYIEFSYADYSSKRKLEDENNQPHIHGLYTGIEDKDFNRWNLISVGVFQKLKALNPPRLYDSNKRMTLLVDIPQPLVEVLIELQDRNMIGELSVRCKDYGIFAGNITKEIIQAEIETGRQFTLEKSTWQGVTKLYDSKEYNNQLWINKTCSSWTFEELCQNCTVEGDSIVTQMVHLEYVDNIIEHIDYERIFYTPDEYSERVLAKRMDIKGTAQPRRKYFKINKASIPFDYPCSVLIESDSGYNKISCSFIFFVLNCFFHNKALLNEYFNDI